MAFDDLSFDRPDPAPAPGPQPDPGPQPNPDPDPQPQPNPDPQPDEPGAPTAALSSLSGVHAEAPFTLDGSASTGEAPLRFEWDLDADGDFERGPAPEPTVTHSYPDAGLHDVRLRVTDGSGRTATAAATVDVSGGASAAPKRVTRRARVGERVVFEVKVRTDRAFRPAYYFFDFGDGSAPATEVLDGRWMFHGRDVSRSPRAVHVFRRPGFYDYKLTAVTADAQIAEIGGTIEVLPAARGAAKKGGGTDRVSRDPRPDADYTGPPVTIERTGVGSTNPAAPPLEFDVRSDLDKTSLVQTGTKTEKGPDGFPMPQPVFEEIVTQKGGDAVYYMGDGDGPGIVDPKTGMREYSGETVIDMTGKDANAIKFRYPEPGTYNVRVLYRTPSEQARKAAQKQGKPAPASNGTGYASIWVKVEKPLCGGYTFKNLEVHLTKCFEPTGDGGFHGLDTVFVEGDLSVAAGRWTLGKTPAQDSNQERLPLAVYPKTGALTTLPGVDPEKQYGEARPLRVGFRGKLSFKVPSLSLPGPQGTQGDMRSVPGLVKPAAGERYENLPVVGRRVLISPTQPGRVDMELALPAPFKGTASRSVGVAGNAQAGGFSLQGGPLGFGPITVKSFLLEGTGDGWFRGGGEFEIFGNALRAEHRAAGTPGGPSGFGIQHGAFKYGGARFEPKEPIPVGPIGLTFIEARLTTDPFFFRGGIGAQFPSSGTPIVTVDTCVQIQKIVKKAGERFFLCKVRPFTDQPLLEFDDCVNAYKPLYAAFGHSSPESLCKGLSEPASADFLIFHMEGAVKVLGEPVGGGYFQLRTGQELELRAGINVNYRPVPVLHLQGGVDGYAKFRKDGSLKAFQVFGHIRGSVADLLEIGLEGVVNQTWAAGCADLTVFGAEIGYVGAWYRFSDGDWDIFGAAFDGCDLKHSKFYIKPAIAGRASLDPTVSALPKTSQGVDIPSGLPVAQVVVTGEGGMPRVEVTGPRGFRFVDPGTPPDPKVKARARAIHIKERNQVAIYIPKPVGGRYTVRVLEGSAPIRTLSTAHGVRPPIVRANVKRRGDSYSLDYLVENEPGVDVTFSETVDGVPSEIGDARRAGRGAAAGTSRRGSVRFSPKLGQSGKRRIEALITRDGIPQRRIPVDTYSAPRFSPPRPPRRIRSLARGSKLRVSWSRVATARGYKVRVRTSDGRDRTFDVAAAKPYLVLGGFDRYSSATVQVAAIDRFGRESPSRRLKVRARAQVPPQLVGSRSSPPAKKRKGRTRRS